MRNALIELHKNEGIERGLFARVGKSKTRGHTFRDRGERFNKKLRGNVFTQRVGHIWNKLPEEVFEAGTLITFKRHLDRCMHWKDLEGYGPNAGKWD